MYKFIISCAMTLGQETKTAAAATQAKTITEKISGTVERVTFHSEETGFCVLRTKVIGHRELVTVLGNTASVSPGEFIEALGEWVNNKNYGLQFKTSALQVVLPTSLEGIEKYLGSGIVKGIGPHFAKKLVNSFGEKVFDIIEQEPQRLLELDGIGEIRKNKVVAAWDTQKAIRDIMVFLQAHGVGTARAVKIYKTYGDKAVEIVKANPYKLATDIYGIGFKTADNLAQKLGIAKDSLIRAQAGIRHVLQQICDKGNCAASYDNLLLSSMKILEISETLIKQAIDAELKAESIVLDPIAGQNCVFPISLYRCEVAVAKQLINLKQGVVPWGKVCLAQAIPWVEQKTALALSASQQQAITCVLHNKVSIITGGPGVGKTTVVNSILQIIRAKKMRIGLCAPTGRAAKRLAETTGLGAKTIHRLLEFDPKSYAFRRNQENPLSVDLLVIDEASMLDIVMTSNLLKAIPSNAALLFVGDIDQLPSVGSGDVLADIINSKVVPVIRLTEIFRQAAQSKIIINAHRINNGKMPIEPKAQEISDFYAVYADTAEEIYAKLVKIIQERIPRLMDCNSITDIQILTPMNRGALGARSLNIELQKILNVNLAAANTVTRFGWTFAVNDKVIQTVNNYDKEVFNGDIGRVKLIDLEESIVKMEFDNRIVEYEFHELDEVSLAYAISIHKSQGSEYPIVVMPIALQHYTMLAKNLLYTGVTRGKKLVVLIGQKQAVLMAIKNVAQAKRLTKLRARLSGLAF